MESRFWTPLSSNQIEDIIYESLQGGFNWIDTAKAYGHGASGQNTAKFLRNIQNNKKNSSEIFIADKWWALARRPSSITKIRIMRRTFLEGRQIDLYQIHHQLLFLP